MGAYWRHAVPRTPVTNDVWQGVRLVGAACGPEVEAQVRELLLATAIAQQADDDQRRLAAAIVPGFRDEGGAPSVAALDYLAATETLPRRLALSNMEIHSARVPLTSDQLRLVLGHFLGKRCRPLPQVPHWAQEAYGSVIQEANRIRAARQRRAALAMGAGLQADCYPPCIRDYLSKLQGKEPVNHHERFNLVAFLHTNGASEEDIIALFRGLPGYDEATTAYQVQHITRKGGTSGYRTMGCRQMRDLEICPDHACPGPTPLKRYAAILRNRPREVPP